jgi:sialic acid synthase SpsE
MKIAKAMIDAAKWAGADTVKFQMYQTELINDSSLHKFLEAVRFSTDEHKRLMGYCEKVGIEYLCSAFDITSLIILADTLKVNRIKIPSGQLHNESYLSYANSSEVPLILSTGMSTKAEVEKAIQNINWDDLIVLHCNSAYPTPDEDTNLKAIERLRCFCSLQVGYSDHTRGNTAAIMAVGLGAVMIEKHFTLSRQLKTPDSDTSIEPGEFKSFVEDIRRAEVMLGSGEKVITESEKPNLIRRDFR